MRSERIGGEVTTNKKDRNQDNNVGGLMRCAWQEPFTLLEYASMRMVYRGISLAFNAPN